MQDALVFTRTKHRANRLAKHLGDHGIKVERIHGNRSQAQRTEALAGFKSGKYRVLVATDIAARGIDVTALGHVVNFDVPLVPEDYIHRVGRTARAEATGSAFTLMAPEEEGNIRAIERAISSRLPRVTLPDFDYQARAAGAAARPAAAAAAGAPRPPAARRGRARGVSVPAPRARSARRGAAARSSAAAGPPRRAAVVHEPAGLSRGAHRRAKSARAFRAARAGGEAPRARGARAAARRRRRSKRSSTRRSGPACAAKRPTSRRSRSRS